ncbi:CGNR zinc finger domain-containing protein [Glycomyces xiaoerkulensis]|uniref:CGNR zinc finger domain-containing protein n=1 Tax=Glycomyces xiaoerkulensis TaxID=2038139 RepID=UPI000C25D1A9|nr:CGNR zinc finger domain-containing protein [Glycomyces xiaoerkulensis]
MERDGSRHDEAPPPLALANTVYTRRGKLLDALATTDEFAAWLARAAPDLETPVPEAATRSVSEADLRDARDLRDAVRGLFAAVAEDREPEPEHRDRLNRTAASAPHWPELRWDGGPRRERRSDAEPVTAALAEIAASAVDLFTADSRPSIDSCASPECVRFLIRDDPRRKWCSPECGNRARVSRYHHKRQR